MNTKIKIMVLTTFVVCGLPLSISSQVPKPRLSEGEVLLSKDMPTVYISFVRAGERKPVYAQESSEGVWLRLHNNTRWAINFCTQSLYIGNKLIPFYFSNGRKMLGLRSGIEVNMCYAVEQVNFYESYTTAKGGMVIDESVTVPNLPVGYNRGHVFSSAWLQPGGSVVFSVPREHLAKRLAIYISYNYEWEYGERTFRSDEPQHRVYFRASDLPKNTQ